MPSDRPLTLTVEQAGYLLGVGRSTAYELVRSGELECLRLRRRLVVPAKRVAERLGITLADVWRALEARPAEAGTGEQPAPPRPDDARGEFSPVSLF